LIWPEGKSPLVIDFILDFGSCSIVRRFGHLCQRSREVDRACTRGKSVTDTAGTENTRSMRSGRG
jgi:hypothetical protein